MKRIPLTLTLRLLALARRVAGDGVQPRGFAGVERALGAP
jgi:hypothetical protein